MNIVEVSMGEITAAVFVAFAVLGPFACWYVLDSQTRDLPLRLRVRAEAAAGVETDEQVD
jgi:hypothetical protein